MKCKSCGVIGDYQENSMEDKKCNNCGQWHNYSGQALNSPDNWNEEIGEQIEFSEIIE